MKNLKKLGFILSVGALATFSIAGCGDDDDTAATTAGASTGGSAAGSGTAGMATGGSSAGTGTAGMATGGGGAATGGGGAATGGGGAATGGGGAAAGGGGSGGKGGGGGTGGTGGGGGSGGGGGAGGAPSAACMTWCMGDNSVVTVCAANNLPAKIATTDMCFAECAKSPPASVTCWNTHVANAKGGDKAMHCPHGEGAPGNGVCPELP